MKKVVLLGAGGYCCGVLDSLKKMPEYQVIGITDPIMTGEVHGIPVLGTDHILPELYAQGVHYAHITVGTVGSPAVRKKLVADAKKIGFELISVIDSTAVIAEHVELGDMVYVGKRAVINSNVLIGDYCMINTGAIVEHGCRLGEFVHVAPGAVVAGDVIIGNESHIGLNASVLQGVKIAENVIIGAGSTVIGNVAAGQTVYGIVKG